VSRLSRQFGIINISQPYRLPWHATGIALLSLFYGSIVSWGTMLQAGRSRVRFPMTLLDFFNFLNPFSLTMTLV
jgi:hypothetical protein